MVSKCQLSVTTSGAWQRASKRSRSSCTANLSPWEKQLLLSFSTNGKDSTQRLLACIMHTDALKTDPDSCPMEVKPRPMKTIYMCTAIDHNKVSSYSSTARFFSKIVRTGVMWLGWAWASLTLAWLHLQKCVYACLLGPYTVNFKWACLNFNFTKIELMYSASWRA